MSKKEKSSCQPGERSQLFGYVLHLGSAAMTPEHSLDQSTVRRKRTEPFSSRPCP